MTKIALFDIIDLRLTSRVLRLCRPMKYPLACEKLLAYYYSHISAANDICDSSCKYVWFNPETPVRSLFLLAASMNTTD
jgi:hypothetical protein